MNIVLNIILIIPILSNSAIAKSEGKNRVKRRMETKANEEHKANINVSESYKEENLFTTIENKNISEVAIDGNECIGQVLYCNYTKEEYVKLLNDYIYPQTYEWVLIATHTAVFVIGLVGNALVCVAVYRNHSMRTVTNYFIVNLAVADFFVLLLCLPPTVLWDVTDSWFLGEALCKILLYFQSVSVTVSILTLTFIALDRWYAICFPLKFKSTTSRAKTAIFGIWTAALLFNSPELIVLTVVASEPLRFNLHYLMQCVPTWSVKSDLIWNIIKVLFIYTIPLLLISLAYYRIVRVLWSSRKIPGQAETTKLACAEETQLRSRKKAAKMLVCVVVMFAVCYFPVHLLSVLRYTTSLQHNDATTFLALVSHVLCYANSALNPLIYNFMSEKFRREFRRAFCCSIESEMETVTTLTRVTSKPRKQSDMSSEFRNQSNVSTALNGHTSYLGSYVELRCFDTLGLKRGTKSANSGQNT